VVSGSLRGWGDPVIPCLDLVVFLYTARDIRLQRLRAREATLFGADAVRPGGWHHQEAEEFIEWASHYDEAGGAGRTLEKHQSWLASLSCPVIRLDGADPVSELVTQVVAALEGSE